MHQVLGLSIFFRVFLLSLFLWSFPLHAKAESRKKAEENLPDLHFLQQAEDVEREAWWIITNHRIEGVASPFRVLRAAVVTAQSGQKKKNQIKFKFCKSLLVLPESTHVWRIESACQKPAQEIGRVEKKDGHPEKWKISWKTGPFTDHFGLSTAILFTQQSCEMELDLKGRLSRMSCPHYVRDRRTSEIIEFKVFEYQASAPHVLKLEGDVKKDLQVIATFSTQVPVSGDIVLKVKKVPQKAVEEKTELSNIGPSLPTRGESNGQKNDQESNPQDSTQIDAKIDEESGFKNNQESVPPISGEGSSEEVPAIETPPISAPPPTR